MMILLRSSVSMPCPPLPPMLSPAPFVDALALCPSGKHDYLTCTEVNRQNPIIEGGEAVDCNFPSDCMLGEK